MVRGPAPPSLRPLATAPIQPADQPSVHKVIRVVKLPAAGASPEVVPPTSQHGIQFRDDLLHILPALTRPGNLPNTVPESLPCLGGWPAMHVISPGIPQDTALLANGTSQEHEASFPTPEIHQPRLFRVQRQTQLAHHKLDLSKSLLRLRFRWRHHHEIVGIPDQHSQRPTALLRPEPVQ